MKVNEYIELNNELRQQLNEENGKYYEEVLLKVRVSAKEDETTEGILYELLTDLIQAQNNEKTAFEYFGKNSSDFAQEIVDNLSKPTVLDFIIPLIMGLLVFVQMQYTGKVFDPDIKVGLTRVILELALIVVMSMVVIRVVFKQIANNVSNLKISLTIATLVLISITMFVLIQLYSAEAGISASVNHVTYGYILVVLNSIIGVIKYLNIKNSNVANYLTTIFSIAIGALAVIGVINKDMLLNNHWLILVFVGLYLTIYFIEVRFTYKRRLS